MTTELAALSSFEIAQEIGCGFIGDCNPIDHDGTFYDTRDWVEHGYSSCVQFIRLPNEGNGASLLVECGTINRGDDLADCFRCCGFEIDPDDSRYLIGNGDRIERTPEVEIECVLAYWGAEPVEDMSGRLAQQFSEDDDGYVDEDDVWQSVSGWIRGLAS